MSYLLENFFTLIGSGLVKGSVYALVALGYTLVYGVLRLINFAHSEVWMWGAFAAVWSLIAVGGGSGQGLPATLGFILLAFVAAMLLSGAVALLVERVAYRRLRRQNSPPLVSLISAIGASFVLGEVMGLRDKIAGAVGLRDTLDEYVRTGRNDTPFANPVESSALVYIGDFRMTNIDLIVVVGAILMMVLLDQFVRRSRLGRGIRAVAMNADAAALMGVNKDRIVQVTFFIGGIMAGAAAVFYLMRFGVVRW
ncbi:MAG: branched-chain amino acid ABC transporter permease, partial [Angustibacter sp.]